MKSFYITTPLYYVNAPPHIGHAYTTLAADVLARWHRLRGRKAHLLTGTDEHGANIEKIAREAGKDPRQWADEMSERFRALWGALGVRYDDFIRTTEPRHERPVQQVFEVLLRKGDIYKGTYEGWYCLPCENFWEQEDLVRGSCPVHGKTAEKIQEESYFFRLSRYQDPLLKHYRDHPDFLKPSFRASEVTNFVQSGLKDLSVSRAKVRWGIGVPGDGRHTIYVWFDALLNYITAAGYSPVPHERSPRFEDHWPAEVHLVGKEIFRFHAVIWPAMLMALDLPLPGTVFAHGWWTVEGEKMSKSKGNFIDPQEMIREFGVDAFRYYLFREVPFGQDGDFSRRALKSRYNAELANDLGNLLSRVAQMVENFCAGRLPYRPKMQEDFLTGELAKKTQVLEASIEGLAFSQALDTIWEVIRRLNQRVDRWAPWEKVKGDPERVAFFLFDMVSSLRLLSDWISPFMPQAAQDMQAQLGEGGRPIRKGPPLFPRK